ncbi:MAG: hypothetical protein R2702_06535 [Acidimicrobiales bacterium]
MESLELAGHFLGPGVAGFELFDALLQIDLALGLMVEAAGDLEHAGRSSLSDAVIRAVEQFNEHVDRPV